jgi:hypothetical protein
MMSQKSSYPLGPIREELQLRALVHFNDINQVTDQAGQEIFINALLKSNVITVLESEIAMPIRLGNDEIYEMVLKNNRGIVAKEGKANRYLVVLRVDTDHKIVAVGDDLDPGMVLFELLYRHK